mgnify:CR=1 FL=1
MIYIKWPLCLLEGLLLMASSMVYSHANEASCRDCQLFALQAGGVEAEIVTPELPISKEFQTFSLFLIPDPEWERANKTELEELKQTFESFGHAIGHKHLAVWFLRGGDSDALDIERMRTYCRQFNLSHEEGPYVVTTTRHPDNLGAGDHVLKIQLKDISASRAQNVLSILQRDLLRYSAQHPSFSEQALELERMRQILLSSVERESDTMKGVLVALIRFGR